MAICSDCGAEFNADQQDCPKCRAPLESTHGQKPPSEDGVADTSAANDSASETRAYHFPDSRWYRLLVALLSITFLTAIGLGNMPQDNRTFQIGLFMFLIFSISLSVVTLLHARETRAVAGWPRFYGLQYAIPSLNGVLAPVFLFNRAEVKRHGTIPVGRTRLSKVLNAPRASIVALYKFLGVAITILLLSLFIVSGPMTVLPEGGVIATILSLLWVSGGLSVLLWRRFTDQVTKNEIDTACRDVLIRIGGITGLSVVAVVGSLILIIPATLLAAIVVTVTTQSVAEAVGFGIVYPIYLIPLATIFVLGLRLIPWLKAIPLIASELVTRGQEMVSGYVSFVPDPKSQSRTATTGPKALPRRGFEHTNVQLKEEASVTMEGTYGYTPTPVQEVNPDGPPSSLRLGALLCLPGYLYSTVFLTAYFVSPERVTEFASTLPGENALVATLSFIGIPRFVITNGLEFLGLPPEFISLGLIGVLVPAALIIPGVWHFALEYERKLYRTLQRLGEANHVLLLWILPLVLPVFLGYWRVRDGLANSRFASSETASD